MNHNKSLQLKPKSPFATIDEVTLESREKPVLGVENYPPDDDVLNMEPKVPPRPRLVLF